MGGMPGVFQTDVVLMTQAAKDVEITADTLANNLTQLMGKLGPLEEMWQGKSGLKFDDLKRQFNTKLLALHASLEHLARLVDGNAAGYVEGQYSSDHALDAVGADLGSGTSRTHISSTMNPGR